MCRLLRSAINLCAIWLSCLSVWGLDPHRAPDQYVRQNWTVDSGLPQSSITALLQTRAGYVWIGTQDGLVRFNGQQFASFPREGLMRSQHVTSLVEDDSGRIWVGLRTGIAGFHQGRWIAPTMDSTPVQAQVLCLFLDHRGNLLASTEGQGLLTWDPCLPCPDARAVLSPESAVLCLHEDSQKNLWAGTRKGLFVQNGETWQAIPGLEGTTVRAILSDENGTLFIGAHSGLYQKRPEDPSGVLAGTLPDGVLINALLQDAFKCLWVGAEGQGLARLTHGDSPRWLDPQNQSITCLMEDHEKSLWVGTYVGLYHYADGACITLDHEAGLAHDVIWTVYQDRDDAIWLTTSGGLNILRGNQVETLTSAQGLSSDYVSCTFRDRSGIMWVGTYDRGLNRQTEHGWEHLSTATGLAHDCIRAIIQDAQGRMWFATYGGGISILDRDSFQTLGEAQGLPSNLVFCLAQDDRNQVWVGMDGGGLCAVNPALNVHPVGADQGFPAGIVMCCTPDASQQLWVGTESYGLFRIETRPEIAAHPISGLPQDTFFNVVWDDMDHAWLPGNRGIVRVSRDQLMRPSGVASIQVFGTQHGMKSRECNGSFQQAGIKARNGELWFPTVKGVSVFDPKTLETKHTAPNVVIEKVLLDGEPHPITHPMPIPPDVTKVEICFAVLTFVAPETAHIKYRMDGLDRDWVDLSQRLDRIATYTRLPHGPCEFHVIAANAQGIWNREGASLAFRVLAPVWRRGWFIATSLCLFAIISYVFIHFSRRYVKLIAFWKRKNFIGHYRLLETIAAGGMGTVYKARHVLDPNKTVAIKIIREEAVASDTDRRRFQHEASIMDQLQHPNIVKVIERGEHEGKIYLAMEYLDGRSLGSLLRSQRRFSIHETLMISRQLAHALTRIHAKNIVHRDLKPDNIMLVPGEHDLTVKLLDFGIAQSETLTRLTETGKIMGTVHYMAPEQLVHGTFSPSSDVYAMGVILYETLTHLRPFDGGSTPATMMKVLNHIPQPPRDCRDDCPDPLSDLILQMMHKEAEYRPALEQITATLQSISHEIRSG